MRSQGRIRASLKWICAALALLSVCALVGTRFAAVDFQTGTRLAATLDQGAAIFVLGEERFDLSSEVTGHDPDQVALQWWFATYPHSLVIPLWAPMLAFA